MVGCVQVHRVQVAVHQNLSLRSTVSTTACNAGCGMVLFLAAVMPASAQSTCYKIPTKHINYRKTDKVNESNDAFVQCSFVPLNV